MDVDVIKSYLVSLGFQVEHSELRKFENALRNATSQVAAATTGANGIAAMFVKTGAVVTGVLSAIAAGTVGLMDNVAQSDLGLQVWARRMYMSTDAARSLKTATDALGYSLEDIIFGPRELQERFAQLMKDQKELQKEVGPGFEEQMRKIRDVRFEFTRLQVGIQYLSMAVVKDLSKALFGDEDSLEKKLRDLNEYLIRHLPEIAQSISNYVAPILKDFGAVLSDLGHIMKTIDWRAIADDMVAISHALAAFFDFLAANPIAQKMILGAVGGGALGSVVPGVGTGIGALIGGVGGLGLGIADESSKHPSEGYGPMAKDWSWWKNLFGSSSPISQIKKSIHDKIMEQALAMGVDPGLALAVANQESGGREYDKHGRLITSPVGAMGIFQLMPKTAQSLGVDATDEDQNIRGGVQYLRDLLQKHHGNIDQALKEYGGFVRTDPSDYVNSVKGQYQPMSLQVDVGGIHITEPHASPDQIKHAVGEALREKLGASIQNNLVQFSGAYS